MSIASAESSAGQGAGGNGDVVSGGQNTQLLTVIVVGLGLFALVFIAVEFLHHRK